MTIKEKLKKYCKYKGITHPFFCRKIDVSIKFLASNGRVYSDVFPRIRKVFTDLNMDWLIFDEGKMIIPQKKEHVFLEEPAFKYESKDYKEDYYKLLEENRALNKKLVDCLEQQNKKEAI